MNGNRRELSLRSPLSREEERAFRRAADVMGFWSRVSVIGHLPPPPWLEPLFAQLTEQVHASIFQLAAKDPRITAALT